MSNAYRRPEIYQYLYKFKHSVIFKRNKWSHVDY